MRWARRSTAQHGIALRWGWYEPIKLATGLVLGVTAAFGTLQAGLASAPSGGAGLLVAVVVLAKAFDAAAEPSEATRSAFLSRAERRRRVQQVLHCPPAPWPQVNPYEIGVFDSVEANMYRASFDQPRPPYVPRPTVDAALHQAITDLPAGTGGVVVLQGHPKAGKSRTLWEALDAHESTNTRTVYALRVPDKRADHTIRPLQTFLDAKPHLDGANALIWIDDAHDHFAYGLTRDRLAQLVGEHAGLIVAMTVHTERLQVPRSQHDEQIGSIDPKLIVYLDQLAQITLELGLDDEEKAAARRLYPELEDSIEDPVDFQRLPSWFAGVSHLRDRYTRNRHQNLGGVAVAKAAIDWRRAGMPAGISLPQLRELACIELEELSAGRRTFTGDDDYANALAWAQGEDTESDPRWRGIALLRPVPGTNGTLWRDFDAITAWAEDNDPPLTTECWAYVLTQSTPATRVSVGAAALWAAKLRHHRGRSAQDRAAVFDIAETAFRQALNSDQAAKAMFHLWQLLRWQGRFDEAEAVFRDAIATGHPDKSPSAQVCLGELLRWQGRFDEAEAVFRDAIATGHPDHAPRAMSRLGELLYEQRRFDEAKAVFRDARATGHFEAIVAATAPRRWPKAADAATGGGVKPTPE